MVEPVARGNTVGVVVIVAPEEDLTRVTVADGWELRVYEMDVDTGRIELVDWTLDSMASGKAERGLSEDKPPPADRAFAQPT